MAQPAKSKFTTCAHSFHTHTCLNSAPIATIAIDNVAVYVALPRLVAGAIGPTNRTGSISPDVTDPGARNVTFEELVTAYSEQVTDLFDILWWW